MSKTYLFEQRQLVEPRDGENASRERPAIGPQKGNAVIEVVDAAWCLGRGADARLAHLDRTGSHKVFLGMLNVDLFGASPDCAFQINLTTGMSWIPQSEVLPSNSSIGRRLDECHQ